MYMLNNYIYNEIDLYDIYREKKYWIIIASGRYIDEKIF